MAICQQITNNDINCDNIKNAFLAIIQIDTQSPPTIFHYPPTHRRTKRPKLYPPRRNDRRLGKRILLYGSSYKTPAKTSTYPNNHCTTTPLRYSNNRQDSLIPIHYQINSYIMPTHTLHLSIPTLQPTHSFMMEISTNTTNYRTTLTLTETTF